MNYQKVKSCLGSAFGVKIDVIIWLGVKRWEDGVASAVGCCRRWQVCKFMGMRGLESVKQGIRISCGRFASRSIGQRGCGVNWKDSLDMNWMSRGSAGGFHGLKMG